MKNEPQHVVIVGGGFGGLDAAKCLKGAPVRVTLACLALRAFDEPGGIREPRTGTGAMGLELFHP